ncbi:putative MAGE family-domain-containing protein [Seiridium cardinale]|uniref:MAGE family-domain-containing protein n=1 Tax=Seiridium cardinale TaxID=138064 RepID=A0ABR2XU82_9PEZI
MPPQTQRRRRTGNDSEEDEPRRRQSRRQQDSDEEEDDEQQDENGDVDMAGAGDEAQLVKKLVRYALACEYARIPIRRDGIRDKVLGNNARSFKRVFDGAQLQLRQVFGMEMAELPVKEKRTLKEKQKQSATQRKATAQGTASSKTYILVSILPAVYKSPSIVSPSRAPSSSEEAEYVGFYTFVIAVICLNGGELSEIKLKDYLDRVNAKENLPFDKTANVLNKLARQGYLEKVVEKSDGDEDAVNWHVGTRGKVEVPPESIAAFVKHVWQRDIPSDLNKRINKSLGLQGALELPDEEVQEEGPSDQEEDG